MARSRPGRGDTRRPCATVPVAGSRLRDGHTDVDGNRGRTFTPAAVDAARASSLCVALDRWRHWADGHHIDREALAEVVATLHSGRLPGTAELANAACEIAGSEPPNVHRAVAPDVDLGIGL